MRGIKRRLKRLEARVDTDDPASWPIEKLLLELASCLCSVPVLRLRELLDRHALDDEHQALSEQETLGLAISRGEEEAYYAAIRTGGEAVEQGVQDIGEVFGKVHEEWRRICDERLATGVAVGCQLPWLSPDRYR